METAALMKATVYSMLLLAALAAGPCAGAKEEEAFDGWFWHITAGLPVYRLNDEGYPYRFAIGGGHPVLHERIALMAHLVLGYYDVSGTADKNPRPDISGGSSTSLGLDLRLRIDLFWTAGLSGYLEGGGGFQTMLGDPPFPADGSDNNLTLFVGPGVAVPVGSRTRLTLSVQYFHISNAWLFESNSGYDGLQLIFGPEWSL